MRPCSLLLWGLLCAIVLDAAILPSSDFIQNIQFNGQESTAHTMTFTCSESNPSGTVLVGDYQVDIECLNPVTESTLTEICTIPQSVLAQRNMVCLVTDETAFKQAADQFIQQSQAFRRRLLASSDRRPLIIGEIVVGAALVMAGAALALGFKNQKEIGKLQGDVRDLGTQLLATEGRAQEALGIAHNAETEIKLTQQQIQLFYNASQYQIAQANHQIAAQDIQIAAIASLANGTTAGLNALQNQVKSTQLQTAAFINSQTNQTDQRIIELAGTMYSLLGVVTEEISNLKVDINLVQQNLNLRAAQIESVMADTTLNNALIQAVHESLKAILSDFFAFTTDAGVAPKDLSGIDLRNIQDAITLNFRTASGSNPIYELHSVTLNFYMDTIFGFQQQIQQGQTVVGIESLPSYFSTSDCQRAYVQSTPDAVNDIKCQLWMETEDYYCQTDLSPRFNFTTSTPTLLQSYCTQGSIQPAITSVKKTYQSTVDYIAQLCQSRDPNSPIVLFSARRAISYSINPPSGAACLQAWDTMVNAMRKGTQQPSLLLEIFVDLQKAWSFANIDLARRRLKLYGAMPGGISVKTEPFFHLPIGVNATNGVPIYDGSATPYRCLQSDFVSIHENTLPVYSRVPANNPAVYKAIRVKVTPRPGFTCSDASICYPVGSSLVTNDIILTNDRPPNSDPSVFVGSLIPDVVQSQGLFDIEDSQLGCSSNTRANENTVCYLRFGAGTRKSPTLPEFLADNNNVYDPTKATVSASDYRFAAIFDREGYPMCSNGVAPGSLSNITVDIHGCNTPYHYTNASIPSFDSASDADPVECVQPGTVLLFNSLSDRAYVSGSALNHIASTSSVFSFWFQSSLVVSSGAGIELVVLEIKNSQATSYLRYIVDSKGIPAVVLSNSATANTGLTMDTRVVGASATRILTKNLRDTVLHHVVWKSTVTQYNTGSSVVIYELWIDTIYQGSWRSTAGTYISSTTNPLYSASAMSISTSISNADSVSLGLFNAVSSQVRLANSYACQQAWFNKRCTQPSGSGERLLIMLQNVTSNNNIFCDSTSQLVLSTTAFDALFPKAVVASSSLFVTAAWSIGFWIRLPAAITTGQYAMLENQHSSFKVALNGVTQLLDISINGVAVSSMNVQDLDSHNIYISYDGSMARAYLDGNLFGSATAVTPASWTPTTSYANFTQGLNYLSMMKHYTRALTPMEVYSEMSCQIDSTLSVRSFIPPIGFCEQSLTDSGRGYCRSPLLCAGHCSAYATIDNSTRTFVVGARNCDDGWNDPACVTRCARVDEATGRCVDLGALWAQASTPLGKMCQSMKDNKVEMNLASMRLYETARKFLYSVTIQIPTGVITSIVGSAQCPKVDLINFGNSGELLATFTNDDIVESNIRIFFAPVEYFNDPANVECRPECCNVAGNGQLFSIAAGVSNSMRIAQCGNMSVSISRLSSVSNVNQYTLCTTLNGESLIRAVTSGNIRQNVNLVSSLQFTVDNTARSLFEFQKNVNLETVSAMILQAGFLNATTAQLEALLRVKNRISAATYLTYNNTFDQFNLTQLVAAELTAAKSELDAARGGLANAQSYLDQIPIIGGMIIALADENRAAITALNNSIGADRAKLKGIIDGIGGGGIGDPFSAIGGAMRDFVKGAIDEGKSILDKGLGALGLFGGGLGNFFGDLIKQLINMAIIVACVLGAYALWTSDFRKNLGKNKKHKREDLDEEDVVQTRRRPPPSGGAGQQRSTQAYFQVRQI